MRNPFRRIIASAYIEDGLALLVRWVMLAFAIWLAAQTVHGIKLDGWDSSLAVAVVLGTLNTFVRPFITRNALPVTVLSFGLFLLVLNAFLLVVATKLANPIEGVSINGFVAALLGAVIISFVSLVLRALIDPENIAARLMNMVGRRSRQLRCRS